jgi:hypothetical protein
MAVAPVPDRFPHTREPVNTSNQAKRARPVPAASSRTGTGSARLVPEFPPPFRGANWELEPVRPDRATANTA